MVVTPGNMFGCYDSYAYRLWSLANVWTNCQFPLAASAAVKTEPPGSEGGGGGGGDNAEFLHIECPQCRKGYPGFQALRDHVEAAHPPPTPAPGSHACMQCSATFAHRDQLEKHELLHSPNATVSCKVCNKTFANVYRLQRHMISHDESAGLRKFKCPECDKAFKFKHHLKEHIRIHSGEKPFECANCGKRFSHSGSYSSHMTSKKCLVMNLKVGRGRGPSNNGSLLDKCLQGRGPKRPGPSLNNNHFAPILPKYATAYRGASPYPGANQPPPGPLPHPYYMAPTSPYKLPASAYHLIHQLSTGVPPPYAAAAAGQHLLQHHYQQQQQLTPTEDSTESRHPIGTETNSGDKSTDDVPTVTIKQELNDEAAATASASGDIEMEDGSQPPASPDSPVEGGGSDLEAVNRILETVNASVTKQSLEAHVLKQQQASSPTTTATSCSSSASTSSSSSSVGSASSPLTINNNNNVESLSCRYCHKRLPSPIDLHQHETYLCCASGAISATVVGSEGLAAKLEDVMAAKTEEMSINGGSGSEDDECRGGGGAGDDSGSARSGGSKVRVRSLIADEQLLILKQNYAANPRPKKDELARIADLIKFPVRVVQVWFQNTRARDRREGRLVHVPYLPSLSPPVPSYPLDQPLDLSLKRASTPSSDGDGDAVNLSRKSNSPASHHFGRSPSPLSVFSFASETPGSKLARILQQPPTPRGMSTVPLDRLAESPLFGLQNGGGSSSPSSDKRSWKQGYLDGGDTTDEADDSGCTDLTLGTVADDIDAVTKRHRLLLALGGGGVVKLGSMLPGTGSAVDGEPEGQFICDQCDKAFSKQSSLARHKYEHSGQRPHKCDVCTKAFKHKHHLTEHKRLHSGEKPFQCMKCLKRFSHSGSYSQHMNHRYSYCKPYRE